MKKAVLLYAVAFAISLPTIPVWAQDIYEQNENKGAVVLKNSSGNIDIIEKINNEGVLTEISRNDNDLIKRLKSCWNLDPALFDMPNIEIEILATLNQDGGLRYMQFVNREKYNSDPTFRAVAESAQRALYACQPYNIPNDKYANNEKRNILFRFNTKETDVTSENRETIANKNQFNDFILFEHPERRK
jgi:hypothetical protein